MKSVVFLGGGRITSALVAGLRLSGYSKPIVVHDRHLKKLRALDRKYGVVAERDLRRAVARADLVVVAVRPDSVGTLLKDIGPIRRSLIAVSLAAGIPLARLRKSLGPNVRWARAMPSPSGRTGRGLTAVTFDRGVSAVARRQVIDLFSRVGPVCEIPESKFDAFTVTYSSSHGYHALATLASAAQKLGLDRKTALMAAAHALADGIFGWRESNTHLTHLLHEAATPGGIAAATMHGMDRAGYQRAIERGLKSGLARARKNATLR